MWSIDSRHGVYSIGCLLHRSGKDFVQAEIRRVESFVQGRRKWVYGGIEKSDKSGS